MEFKDRFAALLAGSGHSVQSLADRLGVTRSALAHLQSGRNQPSFDLMAKMAAVFPHINLRWLLGLDQSMLLEHHPGSLANPGVNHESTEVKDVRIPSAGEPEFPVSESEAPLGGNHASENMAGTEAMDPKTSLSSAKPINGTRIILLSDDGHYQEFIPAG